MVHNRAMTSNGDEWTVAELEERILISAIEECPKTWRTLISRSAHEYAITIKWIPRNQEDEDAT